MLWLVKDPIWHVPSPEDISREFMKRVVDPKGSGNIVGRSVYLLVQKGLPRRPFK